MACSQARPSFLSAAHRPNALPDEHSRYHTTTRPMQVLCTEHMHVALTNLIRLQRTQPTIIATHCSHNTITPPWLGLYLNLYYQQ